MKFIAQQNIGLATIFEKLEELKNEIDLGLWVWNSNFEYIW